MRKEGFWSKSYVCRVECYGITVAERKVPLILSWVNLYKRQFTDFCWSLFFQGIHQWEGSKSSLRCLCCEEKQVNRPNVNQAIKQI